MKTNTIKNNQPSTLDLQVFKPEMSKLLDLTTKMINNNEIKTTLEFAKKFMFSFDSEKQFPINIELLIEMKVYDRKGNLKIKLTKNFENEVDYKIIKATSELSEVAFIKGGSGLLKENIFLTIDCFKSLCMLSNNDIGKETKQYYLDLEKVFKQYILLELEQSKNQLKLKDKTIQITTKELEESNKDKNRIQKLHNQLTQKHFYYKFKTKGPVFYIIENGHEYKDEKSRPKFGTAGCAKSKHKNCPKCDYIFPNEESESLDKRLAQHRTTWPLLQVRFVVFTPDALLLENFIKRVFKNKIDPTGHEIVEDVKPEDIISEAKNFLKMCNIRNEESNYRIADDIEKYNINAITHSKIKKEEGEDEEDEESEEEDEESEESEEEDEESEEEDEESEYEEDEEIKVETTTIITTTTKKRTSICVTCKGVCSYNRQRCKDCYKKNVAKIDKKCLKCPKILSSVDSTLCLDCYKKNRGKVRPTKEEFIKLFKENTTPEIQKILKISPRTLQLWKKEAGLTVSYNK